MQAERALTDAILLVVHENLLQGKDASILLRFSFPYLTNRLSDGVLI